MKLSVIIPTHNRDETLRRTLAALSGQSLPAEDFEVIVVDDGSEEACRQRIRERAEAHRFRFVEKEQGGLASARNLGAEHARGRVLHFLDDDVVPAPDTLRQHLVSHDADRAPRAVVGSLPYPEDSAPDSFLWYLEKVTHYDLFKDPHKYPGGRPPMPPMNGNSSIPRETFFEIGRYDEGFRQYGGEDLELGYRLAQAGIPFVYNPDAIGYHHHLKNFPEFCRDMERAGESLIAVYRKHPAIKTPKKIDIVEDRLRDLPGRKKIVGLILRVTAALPAVLWLPRLLIRLVGPVYPLRGLLFPMYRWVGHYHYAMGMQRGLAHRS